VRGWLLDTNIVSAIGPEKRPLPPGTLAWITTQSDMLYLPTICVAEIEEGISRLCRIGFARRADRLREWFDRILDDYAHRMLNFDLEAARIAGPLSDTARAAGRHPGFPDLAIAAIAKSRDLVVATNNRRHFEPFGVAIFDPLRLQ
jgi:toxin FitB